MVSECSNRKVQQIGACNGERLAPLTAHGLDDRQNMKEIFKAIVLPSVVAIMCLVTILLWMPFGIGYYDFPWRSMGARIGVQIFALSFVCLSLLLVVKYCARGKLLGIGFGTLSVIVSIWGVFSLYSWKDAHLEFLDRRDSEHKADPGAGINSESLRSSP